MEGYFPFKKHSQHHWQLLILTFKSSTLATALLLAASKYSVAAIKLIAPKLYTAIYVKLQMR